MVPYDDGVMRIVQVHATPLFTGTATQPHQIVRVTVAGADPGADAPTSGPVLVRVERAGISTRQPFRIENLPPGAEQVAEVPVAVAAPHGPGSTLAVTAIAESGGGRRTGAGAERGGGNSTARLAAPRSTPTSRWPSRAGPSGWSATSTTTQCGGAPRATSCRPSWRCPRRTASCPTSARRSNSSGCT